MERCLALGIRPAVAQTIAGAPAGLVDLAHPLGAYDICNLRDCLGHVSGRLWP